jgi:hypothetical protein
MKLLSWNAVVAILITAPVIGKLADASLHRLYSDALKKWLYLRAIQFDEYTYIELTHANISRLQAFFDRVFGARPISIRTGMIAGILLFPTVLLGWPMAGAVGVGSKTEAILYCLILLATSVGTVLLSIHITRKIMSRIRPTILSLIAWLIIDLVSLALIIPLPIGLTDVVFTIPNVGLSGAFEMAIYSAIFSYVYFIIAFANPAMLLEVDLSSKFLSFLVLVIVAPTLLHILVALKDVIVKAVIRPFFILVSGLFEYVEQEKQPLTWVFGILGSIPAIIKAWLEVAN